MKLTRDVINKLSKFNSILTMRDARFDIVIIGGAALIMKELIMRVTHDIDCFIISDDVKLFGFENTEFKDEAWNQTINSHANIFEIDKYLMKLEDKLEKVDLGLSNLEVYLPSTEFLIFTKILSGINRKKDMDDIKSILSTGYKIDFVKLSKIVEVWANNFPSKKELDKFNKHYDNWLLNEID